MSVPPVVIGAAPVERSVVIAPGRDATTARTAGLVGGVLGLTVVALFIVGARLAYRPPPQQKSTPQGVTMAPARPAVSDAVTPTRSAPSWLAPTARVVSSAPQALASPAAPRSTPRVESPGAPARPPVPAVATSRPGSPPAAAQASSSAHAPAAASADEPESADSTPSLIPVIPAGPPPEVDPLVRAVQHDIEEESRAK